MNHVRPITVRATRARGGGIGCLVAVGLAAAIILGSAPVEAGFRTPVTSGGPSDYFSHGGKDWSCGSRTHAGHKGTDFAANLGSPVFAAAAGTVIEKQDYCQGSGCQAGWGNYVRLAHADGTITIYAHLQFLSIEVEQGDSVACGEQIAKVGNTSNVSLSAHLHFEVKDASGTSIDPFAGPCSSGGSLWNDQGDYLGRPAASCDGPAPSSSSGASQPSADAPEPEQPAPAPEDPQAPSAEDPDGSATSPPPQDPQAPPSPDDDSASQVSQPAPVQGETDDGAGDVAVAALADPRAGDDRTPGGVQISGGCNVGGGRGQLPGEGLLALLALLMRGRRRQRRSRV